MLRTELQKAVAEAREAYEEARTWAADLRKQHSQIKHSYGDYIEQERLWKELMLWRSITSSRASELESLRLDWAVGSFEEDADGAAVVRYHGRCWLLPAEPERRGDDLVRLVDLEFPKRQVWAHGDDLKPVIKPVAAVPKASKAEQLNLSLGEVR